MTDLSKIKLPNGTTYNLKDSTARNSLSGYLPLTGGTLTGVVKETAGSVVHSATGTAGTSGYVNIATIKITSTYVNSPIEIAFCRRSDQYVTRLYIIFSSVNSTDPTLASFKYIGYTPNAWLAKSTTSTWNLYIQKTESYDTIDIVDYHKPSYLSGVTLSWTNTHAASLPDGATKAILGGSASSATKATQDSAGQQINTTYIKGLSVSGKTITYTKGDGTTGTITTQDTDTTYTSKAAVSGGTDVSLVTTGEKYTWNSKTSNTGTVTKVSTGTGLTGGDITTTGTISLATSGVTAGTKGPTANVTGTEGTTIKVPKITVDTYGRVTALEEYTLTNKNTTYSAATTSANGLMSSTDKGRVDNLYARISGYAVTAGTTSAYTATITGVTLTQGTVILMRFNAANAANATLNVNSLGAKPIYYKGAAIAASIAPANAVIALVYDTTQVTTGAWHCVYSYNTMYSAGTGISLSGTTINNSGVRSITSGSTNGTISVNTNGTSAEVAVKGLGSAAYTASTAYASASHTHSSLVATDITGETVDLNTYNLSSGSPTIVYYNQKTIGGAANITNAPVADLEFLLVVELIRWASTTEYISKQTCYLKDNRVYTRICTNGTWGAWTKLIFSDTTYSAGAGLTLNGTTFRTTVPRVIKSANSVPGINTCIVEEYSNGDSYNLPSNHFYHIYTAEGNDRNYATQLALGMTTSAAYYRNYNAGTWGTWISLVNTDTKVTNTLNTTSKAYLTGTTTATTNTGTQVFDSGIYTTTTAGQLNATSFKVNEKVNIEYNSTNQCLDFVFS